MDAAIVSAFVTLIWILVQQLVLALALLALALFAFNRRELILAS